MGTRYAIALALWVGWMLPFIHKALSAPPQRVVARNPVARWGMILEGVACGLMWGIPETEVPAWRIVLALIFGGLGIVTTRFAVQHLDRQWRFDAALTENHALIKSGPYAIVRHPIYAAMFSMLLSAGLLLAYWPVLLGGIVLFIIGTEIRIHVEETLLRGRFGDAFEAYAHSVKAYIPYLR
jgi:protein-S-isoprenylcysteine O-methyltransferase Ste14